MDDNGLTKGIKSSEFWLSLLAIGVPAVQTGLSGRTDTGSVIAGALLAAVYTIARAFLKKSA